MNLPYSSSSQCEHRTDAAEASSNVLEMQTLMPHPTPTDSNVGAGA